VRRSILRDPSLLRRVTPAVAALLLLGAISALPQSGALCPPGYQPYGAEEQSLREEFELEHEYDDASATICINDKHPESYGELSALAAQRAAIASAPSGIVPAGAFGRAFGQRTEMLAAGQSPANSHAWEPVGSGVLQAGDPGYDGVNGLGLVELAGRITEFAYVPPTDKSYPDTLIAGVSDGGVWMSDATVRRWISIGDSLPTQVVGSVGYTPANGGTIIALTGDGSFGHLDREGAGAYFTLDAGLHWHRSAGVPDDAFGFKVAVDEAHPKIVYAATGAGLFRSTDGGKSFVNVRLPTGLCAGKSNRAAGCLLANIATDVIVQAPGGTTDAPGGRVLAAVGWRGGNRRNPDGSAQSPNNGIYISNTGAPGTFQKSAATGFAGQDRIGRTELGAAIGPDQNHDYVYAMVQDAVLLRGGTPAIDAPTPDGTVNVPTVFNGVYVSPDFGLTWRLMADASELQHPATGSALAVVFQALGEYGPGVQSWYNEWIQPDPTRAVGGVPTRLLFGLEEVWQNENTSVPQAGPSTFKVIGRYFSGNTCLALSGLPACPTNRDQALVQTTTTHPDQHDAIFIPDANGGVTLVAGNDGGVYAQHAALGEDFSNARWGIGANRGFNTLLPYDAVRSSDGTVWMGLQDNGTAKIVDIRRGGRVVERGRTIETMGGDGFFVAVDPRNSDIAYGETPGGSMSATSDGGRTWSAMNPPIAGLFSNPFVMDPRDPKHLLTAGNEVVETSAGPGTSSDDWATVFDLGTADHPGDDAAEPSAADPVNQMTAVDLVGAAAYVGFCGPCDVLNQARLFHNGLATNVGGAKPAKRGSAQGWHLAKAAGLPNRYITSIAMDPGNPKALYVSLGGYSRRWTPPGTLDRGKNTRVGEGHLFLSTDAGAHFVDVSANLPDTPINWITLRGKQVIVATDVGVFISNPAERRFEVLGRGLPMVPVHTVRLSHGDPNLLIAAAYGRGVYSYRFGPAPATVTTPVVPPPPFLGKVVAGPFGFETGDEGWQATTTSDVAEWRRAAPGHASSSSFQVVPYSDDSTAVLLSPKLSLPSRSSVQVTWWDRRNTEPCCDFLTLDWSSNGRDWHSVRSVAGQNGSYPDFTKAKASFVAPAGALYIRFRLTSDALISFPPYEGVALDDITVER
jgi:photosystem II stability/assembly factor-like uncharacterized protein